ncbi:MAG: hypothetical protein IKG01_07765 [Lachnospiraceae bacterium]|nr:hypothetical protein [Lachnospiraceae bacterium]
MKRLYQRILGGLLCGIMCGTALTGLTGCSRDKKETEIPSVTAAPEQVSYEDLIFVGDSRFVGMDDALDGYCDADVRIVAEVGQGLAWLKKTIPDLYGESGKTIIFNLGVNDLYNASAYVEFYNNLPQDFVENNTLIIMTVNPVDEQREAECGYAIKNADIETFNDTMKNSLDKICFKMIDSYTYVSMCKFGTTDGLHYTNQTYRLIFDYAVDCCRNRNFVKR